MFTEGNMAVFKIQMQFCSHCWLSHLLFFVVLKLLGRNSVSLLCVSLDLDGDNVCYIWMECYILS